MGRQYINRTSRNPSDDYAEDEWAHITDNDE